MLVRGKYILTAADPEEVRNGALRVQNGIITEIDDWNLLHSKFPDDQIVGGQNDIIMPGLINAHGHFSEALIAGIAEQYTLWEWIQELVGKVAPVLDFEMAYFGTLLSGIQMLQSGVTLVNDMFVYDPFNQKAATPAVVNALEDIKLRGIVSFGAGDIRSGISVKKILREHELLAEAAENSKLCNFNVGVAALMAQSPKLFKETINFAKKGNFGIHIHLQEVREEVTATKNDLGYTPIQFCSREGLLENPTIAAHCVWIDSEDSKILADHSVGVAHNPISNMILASGICPVTELRGLGVDVGIGIDGAGSNDSQDMLESMKMTPLLQRVKRLQATALSARDAFKMSTIEGAKALGVHKELGSLEVGKKADFVVLNGNSPVLANIHDPFQTIVYCVGKREVREVWIDGEIVLKDGEPVNLSLDQVVERSRPLASKLVKSAGLSKLSNLF